MVTQQDIIDEINRLTLYYNVEWPDIRVAADRAIREINKRLGARFPRMSDILLGPNSTYTFNSEGVDTPYFDEGYIWDVVVPFIAMEVLAKDQEFTTVYQKYAQDYDRGLFSMFQEEFNRVPLAFRQNADVGVFFGADTAAAKIALHVEDQLPVFKFRIHYHVGNANIVFKEGTKFVEDTRAYDYEDVAVLKGWNIELLSADGTTAYKFLGWRRNEQEVIEEYIEPGYEHTMLNDIHLYACWDETPTIKCDLSGVLTIKNTYLSSLTNLEVPAIVNNIMVRTIPTKFLFNRTVYENGDIVYSDAPTGIHLERIILPPYLNTIEASAFDGFQGDEIILPETILDIVGNTYGGIRIETNAFVNTPNLEGIILPTNVHTIQSGAFPPIDGKTLVINCRLLQQNKPLYDPGTIVEGSSPVEYVEGTDTGWHSTWYTTGGINYAVIVNWGYNG